MNKRDDLLREIGASLETLADKITVALATHATPEPAIEETLRERYPGACLAACGVLIGCSSRITVLGKLELGGFCGRPQVCARYAVLKLACDTVAASAKGICSEPCINIKCGYMKGGACLQPETCLNRIMPPQDEPAGTYLLHGYTLEQWDAIISGGYLCEFAPDAVYHPEQTYLDVLKSIDRPIPGIRDKNMFNSGTRGGFRHCRPAQIPGVLRPWFGGDCPVADGTMVLVKFKDEEPGVFRYADNLSWARHGRTDEIVAYMEV